MRGPGRSAVGETGRPLAMIGDVTASSIDSVAALIRPYIRHTPVLRLDRADFGLGAGPLALKLDQLQHSGSFKARGAFANLLLRPVPEAGVVAASGGNHGAAVAYAARQLGVPGPHLRPRGVLRGEDRADPRIRGRPGGGGRQLRGLTGRQRGLGGLLQGPPGARVRPAGDHPGRRVARRRAARAGPGGGDRAGQRGRRRAAGRDLRGLRRPAGRTSGWSRPARPR